MNTLVRNCSVLNLWNCNCLCNDSDILIVYWLAWGFIHGFFLPSAEIPLSHSPTRSLSLAILSLFPLFPPSSTSLSLSHLLSHTFSLPSSFSLSLSLSLLLSLPPSLSQLSLPLSPPLFHSAFCLFVNTPHRQNWPKSTIMISKDCVSLYLKRVLVFFHSFWFFTRSTYSGGMKLSKCAVYNLRNNWLRSWLLG